MVVEDLEATYRHAGFLGTLTLGTRPALVVVDLTRAFTDPTTELGADLDTCVASTVSLARAVRAASAPVVFTTLAYDANLKDAGVWIQKVPSLASLVMGSPSTRIDHRLVVDAADTVLQKRYPSAFAGTHLASLLTSLRVDSLIVAGATTSGCVRATVVDALQYGFAAVVPRECVGDRAAAPHEASLFDINAKYADVVALEDVLAHLADLSAPEAPAPQEEPVDGCS